MTPESLAKSFDALRHEGDTLWDRLFIRDERFCFRDSEGETLVLNSFRAEDLPPLPAPLSLIGRHIVNRSAFARILARRVGKEDVTFYSLVGEPHGTGLDRWLDKRFLAVGSPPLNWRRHQVARFVHRQVVDLIRNGEQEFTFCDFGCGCGMDSLELGQLMERFEADTGHSLDYRSINVDIDEIWIANNQRLADQILGEPSRQRISTYLQSIFDYLGSPTMESDLTSHQRLIISCNGFADFFDEATLIELLSRIEAVMLGARRGAAMIVPLALHNHKQERLSKLVGFNYRARSLSDFQRILERACPALAKNHVEKHSQSVFFLSSPATAPSS